VATGRHFDCPYEWAAHAPIARESGVEEAVLEAIADEADPADMPEPAATIVAYVRAVFDDHAVPDETYDAALARYGESGVVELTTTMGFYSMIAAILNTFEVLPDEEHFA
jgi:4-carboxymuconolactone decarboxylase